MGPAQAQPAGLDPLAEAARARAERDALTARSEARRAEAEAHRFRTESRIEALAQDRDGPARDPVSPRLAPAPSEETRALLDEALEARARAARQRRDEAERALAGLETWLGAEP